LIKKILSVADEKAVKLWDIESNECIKTFKGYKKVSCVKKASHNKIISGDMNGK